MEPLRLVVGPHSVLRSYLLSYICRSITSDCHMSGSSTVADLVQEGAGHITQQRSSHANSRLPCHLFNVLTFSRALIPCGNNARSTPLLHPLYSRLTQWNKQQPLYLVMPMFICTISAVSMYCTHTLHSAGLSNNLNI